jgi:2-phospho-L-lactate guanylyltransferase
MNVPQGTIKTYDEATKSGVILDDAKNEIAFDADSFKGTGVRGFRLGQRVKWTADGGKIAHLTLVTL